MAPNLKTHPVTTTVDDTIEPTAAKESPIKDMPPLPSNDHHTLSENEEDIIENLGPTIGGVGSFTSTTGGQRRVSRASLTFFQKQTSNRSFQIEKSLIGQDGKLQDDYILKRQSVNKPLQLKKIPLLADLTTEIKHVDGWVLTQLFLSGYARMASKVDLLNKINVFPIADGDTGANMKVCMKLPVRNLLLFPEDSLIKTTSNLAADVLLNGQGNSGTILSHFFVSLAEETKALGKESLTIKEFANLLSKTGSKMNTAVPNPVEGTLLSVSRDACQFMLKSSENQTTTLKDLLEVWNTKAQTELKATPEKLVVDGVKVLEKAGVVDSGAAGFVYLVEGMYMASQGQLPEATNPELFLPAKTGTNNKSDDELPILEDHTLCDSKYQYCTETVILLKDGVTKDDVLSTVTGDDSDDYGDSVVCVGGPSKCGGNMCKLHIHSNDPQKVFDRVREFSRSQELKKEKVEDMWIMRDNMHGFAGDDEAAAANESAEDDGGLIEFEDAKFSILGLSKTVLPPQYYTDDLGTLPVFVVPGSTQEPIDMRHATETDLIQALNEQRFKETATRYTTAAANPMQIKIELLAMLQKRKPVLVFVFSADKRVSALGRNIMSAIDMLEPEQQAMVKVLVHGWATYEGLFIKEAMDLARQGKTIDEACDIVKEFADRRFFFMSVLSSRSVSGLVAFRPQLFPKDFKVEQGSFYSFGQPPKIREGEPWPDIKRAMGLLNMMGQGCNSADLIDTEIQRIKDTLQPDQKIEKCWISCVGRPDKGKAFVDKMKAANVPMMEEPVVFGTNMLSLTMSSWGEFTVMYKVV